MSTRPTLSEIERILLAEVSNLFPNSPNITNATPLQPLGLDSMGLFELFVAIEKQFGLSLLESPLSKAAIETVSSLSAHIATKLSSKA